VVDIVLDENVYIRALEAECTQDGEDLRAGQVVLLLQERHRWVFSSRVIDAYMRQFSARSCRGALTSRLMTSMSEALADSRRFLFLDDAPTIEGSYHHKDRHMVAVAAARKGCCLVTMDIRLRNALESSGIPQRFGFQVLDLQSAEPLLGETPE
jgi:predicted nucleic acid-binding protein